MHKNFIPAPQAHLHLAAPSGQGNANPNPDREPVRILVIGSEAAINATVQQLHQIGYAHIHEWSPLLVHDSGRFMRILTRYILFY
jgi:hypothetical protein